MEEAIKILIIILILSFYIAMHILLSYLMHSNTLSLNGNMDKYKKIRGLNLSDMIDTIETFKKRNLPTKSKTEDGFVLKGKADVKEDMYILTDGVYIESKKEGLIKLKLNGFIEYSKYRLYLIFLNLQEKIKK